MNLIIKKIKYFLLFFIFIILMFLLYKINLTKNKSNNVLKLSNIATPNETMIKEESINNLNMENINKNDTESKLILTDDYIENEKIDILRFLYEDDLDNAINLSNNIINTYKDINNEKFHIFLEEVINLKNYKKYSLQEKSELLEKIQSPELILYIYLNLDINHRNEITKNKQSKIITNKNVVPGVNLIYLGNFTAGLYSEMDINNAYFTIPKDIDGYKIKFILNEMNYNLYYIKYKYLNKIEIIYLENTSNYDNPIIKNFNN